MGAKYQGYPEYKESGVEWLGETPAHWSAKPLKFLCTYNDEVLADSVSDDYEIEYVDIGSVSATEGVTKTESMFFGKAPSRARRIVLDGDVIISTVRTYLEAIAPIDNPPENLIVSTGFAVIRPNKLLHKGYAAYCLRASGFIKEVVAQSVGISYPAINASDLVNIKAPEPMFEEQEKIANFLDHETAKIDTLIEKQQQLIKLLKEKRQAVISHAVTKGLNPNAPMRDSGVEWLGEVPEHWGVKKSFYTYLNSPKNGISPAVSDAINAVPTFSISAVRNGKVDIESNLKWTSLPLEGAKKYRVGRNDILLVRGNGNLSMVGQAGIVKGNVPEKCIYPDILIKVELSPKCMTSEYFVNAWNSYYVREQLERKANTANGTYKVSGEDVKNIFLSEPPIAEQNLISDYLSAQTNKFDKLVNGAEQAVKLLKERRTALISAAVTGKIDVRNWQAPEPSGNQNKEVAA